MISKEAIIKELDYLFDRLKDYPFSKPIADAINYNLELLAELEESEVKDAN